MTCCIITYIMACAAFCLVMHRYEQQCERVWHSVGTVELAFLSVSPCQLLFRSSTQETCAPAEKAWQTQHNSLRAGGALKQERMTQRERERHKGRVRQGVMQNEIKSDKRCGELEWEKQGEAVALITLGKEPEEGERRWRDHFIADRARERESWEGQGIKRKGDQICGRKRRGQSGERRGRREQTGEKGVGGNQGICRCSLNNQWP